jgi:hypothetical protein
VARIFAKMVIRMDALKGQARPIVTLKNSLTSFSLVTYADGSWGILRDGAIFCVWEPAESGDCLITYARLCNSDRTNGKPTMRGSWRDGSVPASLDEEITPLLESAYE